MLADGLERHIDLELVEALAVFGEGIGRLQRLCFPFEGGGLPARDERAGF